MAVRCVDSRRRRRLVLWFVLLAVGFPVDIVRTQTTKVTTDPVEARALNTIFERWGISATDKWNISGELCSGDALVPYPVTDVDIGIKCGCNYNNSTTCHITTLRVVRSDVSGPIPDELWNLTYLDDLNLSQNYLTGPLSASVGRLTRMMSLTANALSGEVPKELGMLTNLRSLAISINNFSGPLPSELGSLTRLTQIYVDSAGVSGPIPATFAALQSLEKVLASDNEFTGNIPDFIGNWSKLIQLRLQGNSFQGPIPQSFSNLTSLTDLRISDLSNGSTSLNFLRNMNSLYTLVLRNNNISGSIPSSFAAFQSLKLLDLSFNKLTGTVPESLVSLNSLTHLFLGNNKLTGTLPSQKNPSLQYIDLSYNELSGSIPSWVSEQNLQLNLVANNFTIEDSNSKALPSGLNCLQRSFPCHRGSPIYSKFAIKCGGEQIRTSDGVVYESDNETLGPATYYMTTTGRWAVSNAGLPADANNPQYTTTTLTPFTNTLYSELFRTARLSAGSLRYYGLGLENGNYNVTLQFAESEITESRSWRSLGRRVFDIYIQGNLKVKDFDIRREAGGVSSRAVEKQFRVEVVENYMNIHLFWAGKGTVSVPFPGTYGPSISAISATADFIPNVSNNPPGGKKNRSAPVVEIVIGVVAAGLLSLIAVFIVLWRRKKQINLVDAELMGIDARPSTFSYAELRAATGNFDPCNKLGEGGFGPVYKGTLGDGRAVAIKRLSAGSHQGKSQFVAEIATIYGVQHRNLVKLYGCCIEGDKRLLVYEYLKNKSLDKLLFGTGSRTLFLDWAVRYNICVGVARGLAYLHEESRLRIVHRDVKASNILLDSNLTPKISDFGLAKLYDDEVSHISTRVAGTIGYLAPEYAMFGHLTEKADTFSFGVVALEIVSGKPSSHSCSPDETSYLLERAWNLHEKNEETDLVDSSLPEYNADEAARIISVALLCTQASPALRPAMSRAVAMLTGDIEVASVATRPGYLTDWRFNDVTAVMSSARFGVSSMNSITNSTMTAGGHLHSPVDPANPILLHS
ncbi:probable LRR receptor-like serine/threonine-protein kinase At1g56140 isoform X3 [Andrographis paniculata]|uniref:probable LRR receptor-like serine/threonine-protein kinase At1g56140 isoform X3 n=1 Tax=Andrographis paniculata TaxID=175694 RepID=UPI0021E8CDDF|nr:probable LRR receptor-like serine/threonine-protein kinase At1g56140 isoform X3 [Andrographis paniculata]